MYDIPVEILFKILSQCDFLTVINFGKTCTSVHNIVKDPYFWSIISNNQLGIKSEDFMKFWTICYDTHTKKLDYHYFRSNFYTEIPDSRHGNFSSVFSCHGRWKIFCKLIFNRESYQDMCLSPALIFGFLDRNLSSKYLDNYSPSKIPAIYVALIWLYIMISIIADIIF